MQPPKHRIDHVMTYISPASKCWDFARLGREERALNVVLQLQELERQREAVVADGGSTDDIDKMIETERAKVTETVPWQTQADHPMHRYRTGMSRYDVETVREYILPDARPIEYKLRRAKLRHWGHVVDLISSSRQYESRVEAIALSLDRVVGLEIDLGRESPGDPLSDEAIDELRQRIGDREFGLLGQACIIANAALSSPE
jgi:hypothetical protein